MRKLALLVLLVGCHKSNPNCEPAVKHVIDITVQGPPGAKFQPPSAGEQQVIDQIVKASIDKCDAEGLSDAQRDCILAATSLTDRAFLTCPALVAKRPSWILAPIGHPEAVDEINKANAEKLRQQPPTDDNPAGPP